ncbi:MAG: GNAT family N-acetyltransferase [Anaerolineaceae bacterium]|nr:GNAT family N-acetyltransferase [Anaerolineaceae bacterium]
MKKQRDQLTFRPVQSEDIEHICQFPQNAEELFFMFPKADYPLTATQLQNAIDKRFDASVVCLDEKPVGFANFYECAPQSHCSIGNVVVDPDKRGSGIAKYLITEMMNLAFSKYAVTEVHISCFNHNTAALLLYSKYGFTPSGLEERISKQGEKLALIHMRYLRKP